MTATKKALKHLKGDIKGYKKERKYLKDEIKEDKDLMKVLRKDKNGKKKKECCSKCEKSNHRKGK